MVSLIEIGDSTPGSKQTQNVFFRLVADFPSTRIATQKWIRPLEGVTIDSGNHHHVVILTIIENQIQSPTSLSDRPNSLIPDELVIQCHRRHGTCKRFCETFLLDGASLSVRSDVITLTMGESLSEEIEQTVGCPNRQPEMSSNTVPFISISRRRESRLNTQKGIKVVLLLVGLAFCLQVFESSPEWKALLALGDPIEPIVLRPTENIQLQSEMVFPQMHMLTSPGFQKVTGDRHIWAYMQSVDVGEDSGLVYFFKFKNRKEAQLSLDRIQASGDFLAPHKACQFGSYTVLAILTHKEGDSGTFYEEVFRQVKENFRQVS